MALRNAAGVMISLGRGPPFASATACFAGRFCRGYGRHGWQGSCQRARRAMPSASTRQPIVLAVPITMQVPCVGARRPLSTSISSASI